MRLKTEFGGYRREARSLGKYRSAGRTATLMVMVDISGVDVNCSGKRVCPGAQQRVMYPKRITTIFPCRSAYILKALGAKEGKQNDHLSYRPVHSTYKSRAHPPQISRCPSEDLVDRAASRAFAFNAAKFRTRVKKLFPSQGLMDLSTSSFSSNHQGWILGWPEILRSDAEYPLAFRPSLFFTFVRGTTRSPRLIVHHPGDRSHVRQAD